jgi:hypothetical protein
MRPSIEIVVVYRSDRNDRDRTEDPELAVVSICGLFVVRVKDRCAPCPEPVRDA